jgi:hypothetical protein
MRETEVPLIGSSIQTAGEHLTDSRIYLRRDNVIEAAILDFAKEAEHDEGPNQNEQMKLIKAVKRGEPEATILLTSINRGLIGTIVYDFKHYLPNDSELLLIYGNNALVAAAYSYSLNGQKTSFVNFAIPYVKDYLHRQLSPGIKDPITSYDELPIFEIYRLLNNVRDGSTNEQRKIDAAESHDHQRKRDIILNNIKILRYINLPETLIVCYGIDLRIFYSTIEYVKNELDLPNRASVALACIDVGVVFALPPIPPKDDFTADQLEVLSRIHLPYEDVSNELNKPVTQITAMASRMKTKMGVRTRTELALMARLGNLTPDLVSDVEKPFTTFQRKIFPYIFLTTNEIVEKTGISAYSVQSSIHNAAVRVGLTTRRELARYLQENGYDFVINEPTVPLGETFDADQMNFLQLIHMSDEAVSRLTGMEESAVGSFVHLFRKKVGARNRLELSLMAYKYDNGERKAKESSSKREKLANKLGWAAMDISRLQELLNNLSPRTSQLIKAYYLSDDENISWRDVSDTFQIDRAVAIATASKGIIKVRHLSRQIT